MDAGSGPLMLGIDTGGTYTDAVLFREGAAGGGVVAKAKALTTRHDLAIGIAGAVDAVLESAAANPAGIALVSMSTTLATNAIVEGQGGRAALVLIGFGEADLDRDGLKAALGADPVLFLPGGHDVHGNEKPLDLAPLTERLPELAKSVTGFAVCAYFAVRNPAHEIAAARLIREKTGLPVTMSHELSANYADIVTGLVNQSDFPNPDRIVDPRAGLLALRRGSHWAADVGLSSGRLGSD